MFVVSYVVHVHVHVHLCRSTLGCSSYRVYVVEEDVEDRVVSEGGRILMKTHQTRENE